jgi:hypothetical protein
MCCSRRIVWVLIVFREDALQTRLEARVIIRLILRGRGLIEKELREPRRNLQVLRHPSATTRSRPLSLAQAALRFGKRFVQICTPRPDRGGDESRDLPEMIAL